MLRNRGDRPVAIRRVEAPQWLRAQWRPAGEPGRECELVVGADPAKLRAAPGTATLAVHTDPEEVGPVFIPVRLKGPLEPAADHVAFGTVAVGKAGLRRVLLRAAPGLGGLAEKDLVLSHTLGDELDVQAHRQESPGLFVLVVRFQPRRPRGDVEGELEVRIREGTGPPVRVRFSGNAAPSGGGGL
jgi:hypothetical protein